MTYTIAKLNIGSPRTYTTAGNLERALKKAGALEVEIQEKQVRVEWAEGVVAYSVDAAGHVDQQLAWDMESAS